MHHGRLGTSSSSRSAPQSSNPFGPKSTERGGEADTNVACMFRHEDGTISTLRLQNTDQLPVKGPARKVKIVIDGSMGDLVVEGTRVTVNSSSARTSDTAADKILEELSPGEHLWQLFASQVAAAARGEGDALGVLQKSLEANPEAVAENLTAHLADLAVA